MFYQWSQKEARENLAPVSISELKSLRIEITTTSLRFLTDLWSLNTQQLFSALLKSSSQEIIPVELFE